MQQLRAKLDDHLSLDKFLAAHRRASQSKGLRYEVLSFNLNKYGNLFRIMDAIRDETYLPSKSGSFGHTTPRSG